MLKKGRIFLLIIGLLGPVLAQATNAKELKMRLSNMETSLATPRYPLKSGPCANTRGFMQYPGETAIRISEGYYRSTSEQAMIYVYLFRDGSGEGLPLLHESNRVKFFSGDVIKRSDIIIGSNKEIAQKLCAKGYKQIVNRVDALDLFNTMSKKAVVKETSMQLKREYESRNNQFMERVPSQGW